MLARKLSSPCFQFDQDCVRICRIVAAPAKVAAHMIRQAVADTETNGSGRQPCSDDDARHDDTQPPEHDGRPPWLEPYGGSREWRGLMWGAIVGPHTRYPEALSSSKDGWWRNATQLETLSALAVWRR